MPLTAVLVAATAPTAAIAEDWVKVGDGGNTIVLVDRDSMRTQSNGFKRAWQQSYVGKPGPSGANGWKSYDEYDCREGRVRSLQTTFLKGDTVLHTITTPGQWTYTPPGTIAVSVFNFVCFGKLPQ